MEEENFMGVALKRLLDLKEKNQVLSYYEFSKRAMDIYEECVDLNTQLKAFTLLHYKAFNGEQKPTFDSKLIKVYSTPENQEMIEGILQSAYQRKFGLYAQCQYGMAYNIFYKNLPPPTSNFYHLEEKFFPHDDDFRLAIQEAPKFPLEDWKLVREESDYKDYSKRVIFKIGKQVMSGEINKKVMNPLSNSDIRSSISFIANYRGWDEYKFLVDRWDYKPLGNHANFFDEKGEYCPRGSFWLYTDFSHRHLNTFRHRSIFGPFLGADVRTTPINSPAPIKTGERIYTTFEDMEANFLDTFNVYDAHIAPEMLEKYSLRVIGDAICPSYNIQKHRVVDEAPKGFKSVVSSIEKDPTHCNRRLNIEKWEGITRINGEKPIFEEREM